jgi:hypothetical protein
MVIGDNPSAIGVPIGIDWWSDSEDDPAFLLDDMNLNCKSEMKPLIIASPIKRSRRVRRIESVPAERRWTIPLEQYEEERTTRRSRHQLHRTRKEREEM